MSIIEKLTLAFQALPGIGPRQAKRLIFALLAKDDDFIKNLSFLITELRKKTTKCPSCFCAFELTSERKNNECRICRDISRNQTTLLVVQKEIDLENIEKTKCYNGKYFVLGGTISLLNPVNPLQRTNGTGAKETRTIRMRELFEKIKNNLNIKEVILAMNADREGDATTLYINRILEPFIRQRGLKITNFGRGLSSGAEIEYIDKDTIQNAFLNRK